MSDAHAPLSSSPVPSLTSGGEPALDSEPRHERGSPSWSEDDVRLLKSLQAQQISAGRIGAELGRTRSAIIAKLRRLGFRCESCRPNTGSGRPRKATPAGTRALGNMMQRLNTGQPLRKEAKPLRIEAPPDLPAEPTPATACTIFDLTNETCRWPLGEVIEPVRLFCGSPGGDLAAGNPYCGFHAQLSYAPARSRL